MRDEAISVELDGVTYHGSFRVTGGVVTVRMAGRRTSNPLGGAAPDMVARVLLRDLVRAHKRRGI